MAEMLCNDMLYLASYSALCSYATFGPMGLKGFKEIIVAAPKLSSSYTGSTVSWTITSLSMMIVATPG